MCCKKGHCLDKNACITSQHYTYPFSEHICFQLRFLDEKAESVLLLIYSTLKWTVCERSIRTLKKYIKGKKSSDVHNRKQPGLCKCKEKATVTGVPMHGCLHQHMYVFLFLSLIKLTFQLFFYVLSLKFTSKQCNCEVKRKG